MWRAAQQSAQRVASKQTCTDRLLEEMCREVHTSLRQSERSEWPSQKSENYEHRTLRVAKEPLVPGLVSKQSLAAPDDDNACCVPSLGDSGVTQSPAETGVAEV